MKQAIVIALSASAVVLTACGGSPVHQSGGPGSTAGVAPGSTVATTSSRVAPPSQAAGYHLVFSDDFDSQSLSPNGSGSGYNWYNPGIFWDAAAPYSNISVSNSTLNLTWKQGQGSSTTSIATASQSGANYKAWTFGYFEARFAWDPVTGSWPAFWLVPVEGYSGQHPQGEFDIMEGQGAYPNHVYFHLHIWNSGGSDSGPAGYDYTVPSGVDLSQPHTYGLLWTQGHVSWYFDNQLVYSVTYNNSTMDSQHYYIILGTQEGANWSYGNTSGVTATSIPMHVDWVHVFQP